MCSFFGAVCFGKSSKIVSGYFPNEILKNRSLWRIMCLAYCYLNKNNDAICNRKVTCCAITTISINSNIKQSHQQFQSELLDDFDRFVLETGFFMQKFVKSSGASYW